MRQQVKRSLSVPDEVVIDEIDRTGDAAFQQPVEFGGDLLRRFEAWITAVKSRDIAEFALIRATAGILDAAEKIPLDVGEFIGRNWKFGHVETVGGLQHHLLLGPRRVAGK